MFGKFEVVYLCGSPIKDNYNKFRYIEEELAKLGYIVLKPVFYNIDDYNKYKDIEDEQCYEKLKMCDILCIVTKNIDQSVM